MWFKREIFLWEQRRQNKIAIGNKKNKKSSKFKDFVLKKTSTLLKVGNSKKLDRNELG